MTSLAICSFSRFLLLLSLVLSTMASARSPGSSLTARADWPEYLLTMYSPADTTCGTSSFTYNLTSYWNCVAGPYYSEDLSTSNLGTLTHFTVKNETVIPAGCKCVIKVHTDFVCDSAVAQTFDLSGAQSCVTEPAPFSGDVGMKLKHKPAIEPCTQNNPSIIETCTQKCYAISRPVGEPGWPSDDCARVGRCGSLEYFCTGC